MDKFKNIGLDKILTSVYDFGGLTTQEVWCKFAQKINIIIEHFNYLDKKFENEKENNKAKIDYLLGEGLKEQVAKELLIKIKDGTIEELINTNVFNGLNITIENNKTDIESKLNSFKEENGNKFIEINSQLNTMENKLQDFVVIKKDLLIDDYTTILKEKLQYCDSNNIKRLKFLEGDFIITSDIEIPTNITIEGCNPTHVYNGGSSVTNIIFKNCSVGFDLKRNPYVTIKNIRLDGNNTTNTVINFGFFTNLENVTITGGVVSGGLITTGQNGYYKNCSFSNNTTGLIINDILTSTQTFENCYFRENKEYGLVNKASDCYFSRCTFESNIKEGCYLSDCYKLINFEYCYWEGNAMPNGNNVYLKNGKYTFNGCDFGSIQIVTVANIINSTVEFKNCQHMGSKESLAFVMDELSTVISDNSFKDYPLDVRTIVVGYTRQYDGEAQFLLSESPNYIDVNYPVVLDKTPYSIQLTVNCTEKMTVGVSNRDNRKFRINIYDKPLSSNASIFYTVKF